MRAMVLEKPRQPLVLRDVPKPNPEPGQLLVRVSACAVCRTDLHIVDVDVAPLLCAGLIGYRSLRKTGDAHRLGLYGFGNAAHLIAQVAIYQGREVFAFTRPGDKVGQESARKLGANWAGGSDERPPET